MQIGQQVVELVAGQLRGGHHLPSVQDDLREPLVGGRRARGHGLQLGERLQSRPMQPARGGRVVTIGALLAIDLCPARLFDGPLRLRLGGRQRAAAGQCPRQRSGKADRKGPQSKGSSKRTGAHLPLMIQNYSAAAIASALRSLAFTSASLPGLWPFTRIENASVLPLAAVR